MKQYLLVLMLLIRSAVSWGQHTPIYSQYYMNGLVINPAYSGTKEALCVNAISRAQWLSVEGAPKTQLLSAHVPTSSGKMAGGIVLSHDKIGITSTTNLSVAYAYRLKLGNGKLAFGISPGFQLGSNNWNMARTTEADLLINGSSGPQKKLFTGSGLYYSTSYWFAGVSYPQLLSHSLSNEQSQGSSGLNNPLFITAGYLIKTGKDFRFKPSVLMKQYVNSRQFDLNINFYYKNIFGSGLSFRTAESITGMVQYTVARNLKMGYTYDYPIGLMRGFSTGSHEIMFEYILSLRKNAVNPRYF